MAQHNMVSLERPASKSESAVEELEESSFPLSLFISDPEIEKLGLSSVKIGEEHDLIARVKVTGVSVDEREGSERHQSVTLTLLAGEVGSDHGPDPAAQAKKLHPEMK